MKTVSVIFELDSKYADEFLAHISLIKTFMSANNPEELVELFEQKKDADGFLQYGLPYVEYLRNLTNVIQSAKVHTTVQQDRARRNKKTYRPVLGGNELSPQEIEQLETKLFGRRLLYPNLSDAASQELFAPWYANDPLYENVLHFLENTSDFTEILTSEELEYLVNHIITCANEFRLVEVEMDLLDDAVRGFSGVQSLQLPYPLSMHLSVAQVIQGGDHPSIRFPGMYKNWEYRVIDFIYGRTDDHFGRKNLSEYQLRIIAGYIAVLIGIFKSKEEFEEKNTSGTWHEYLAKNVKNHFLKTKKANETEAIKDSRKGK